MSKLLAAFALVVGLSSSVCFGQAKASRTLETTLIGLERQLCAAVMAKDTATFERLVDPEVTVAEEGRIFSRNEGMRFHVEDVQISKYELSDFRVVPVTNDVAVLYMKAVAEATRGGKKLPSVNFVSTIWARKGKTWKAVYSTSYTPPDQ